MPGSGGSFTYRLPGTEIVLSSKPFVCLGRHIRSHIRGIEGTVQLWLRVCFSARALYIRPQRKLACRRLFQISVIWVPSFLKFPLTYKACGFVVCIIFSPTHIVNRLIPVFFKLSFLHDGQPAFAASRCAVPTGVTLLLLRKFLFFHW